MSQRFAVTVGINTYPRAPLQGCVNDAVGWANHLSSQGYYVAQLHDEYATKATILAALEERVRELRWGGRLVFTYSGHGTWLPDYDGDEVDARDEALCAYDYESGGTITDDELAQVFAKRRRGTRVVVVSDSCHSGTLNRFASPLVYDGMTPGAHGVVHGAPRVYGKGLPRYVSPFTFLEGKEHEVAARNFGRGFKEATTTPRNSAGVVLLSGCADSEFSYDAYIGGRYQGAFSAVALGVLNDIPNASIRGLHRMVCDDLPSAQFPQSPQMYASLWQRGWTL